MAKFEPEPIDLEKSRDLTSKVNALQNRLTADPGFRGRVDQSPEATLAELGFTVENIRGFSVRTDLSANDSCVCTCVPGLGGGNGCNILANPKMGSGIVS